MSTPAAGTRALAAFVVTMVAATGTDAQTRLYLAEYQFDAPALKSMNLDGTDVQVPFAMPASDWLLVGLAIDEAAGRIYWLHGSTPGLIRSANLDGTDQAFVVGNLKNPRGLALDSDAGKIYWSSSPPAGTAGGQVERANLDGSGVELVYLDPDFDPLSSKIGQPTVDAVNGYVYFGSNDRILCANLDGPPFHYHVVATGASTPTSVQLDVAGNQVYWLDTDTISDALVRVDFGDTNFTIVADATPNQFGSSGLGDLALDLAAGLAYCTDEITQDDTEGVNLVDLGSGTFDTIYFSPADVNPYSLTFDVTPPQPMQDCNDNKVRDKDDVDALTSADCNDNGVPDECEGDPCAVPRLLLDHGADLEDPLGRALGGAPANQSWIIFQPFEVPSEGWNIANLRINGRTNNYHPDGFTATIFPDTGGNYPDESQPLASADGLFRFSQVWVDVPVVAALPEGQHWVRLTANGSNVYAAFVTHGLTGLPSFSRSGLGNDFPSSESIALQIVAETACAVPSDCGDLDRDGLRDDACMWYSCNAGTCVSVPRGTGNGGQYGQADMGSPAGATVCDVDGVADGNDRFHALNCFSNSNFGQPGGYPCEMAPPNALNTDSGSSASCILDGVCDGNDAFHALNGFANANFGAPGPYPCACSGPAPMDPHIQPTEFTSLKARATEPAVPGGLVEVDVYLERGLAALRGYQLHLRASGGTSGALDLVDVFVKAERPDYAFQSAPATWSAFNLTTEQMVVGMDAMPGTPVGDGSYLATFTYRVSKDAAGTFTVEVLYDASRTSLTQRTFLFGEYAAPVHVKSITPAEVTVIQTRSRGQR